MNEGQLTYIGMVSSNRCNENRVAKEESGGGGDITVYGFTSSMTVHLK